MIRPQRRGLTATASRLLGVPVDVAVPVQRRRPDAIFAVCLAELAALIVVVVTVSIAAFAALVALSAALAVLWATNGHRLLAVTSAGVVVLGASRGGRPVSVLGPATGDLCLPRPAGLCVPVSLDGRTWWVDRGAFPRLRRARELGPEGGEDQERRSY